MLMLWIVALIGLGEEEKQPTTLQAVSRMFHASVFKETSPTMTV